MASWPIVDYTLRAYENSQGGGILSRRWVIFHTLQVTISVLEMYHALRPGFGPAPGWEGHSALPGPLAGFGVPLKGRERRGARRERGKEDGRKGR